MGCEQRLRTPRAYPRYDKMLRGADMQHIDYGLSVFAAKVFRAYPADEVLDLAQVMRTLVDRGEMAGFEAASASTRSAHMQAGGN